MTPLRLKVLCAAMQYPSSISLGQAYRNGYVLCGRSTVRQVLLESCTLGLTRRSRLSGYFHPWPEATSLRQVEYHLRRYTQEQIETYAQYADAINLFLSEEVSLPRWYGRVYPCWRRLANERWHRRHRVAMELLASRRLSRSAP